MLKVLVYLLSILRLLAVGKWYPPAHVCDVSVEAFNSWAEAVKNMGERLELLERKAEATRQKVYREEVKSIDMPPQTQHIPKGPDYSSLQAGDEVPEGVSF